MITLTILNLLNSVLVEQQAEDVVEEMGENIQKLCTAPLHACVMYIGPECF